MVRQRLLHVLWVIGWVTSMPVRADHVKLFVLTGQSNSLGVTNGGETDVSIGQDPADGNIRFWWSNVVDAATPLGDSGGEFVGLCEQQGGFYAGSATHWGPEIGFARCLYQAGVRNFGVIKASRGGGGNLLWSKEADGSMYQHVVATVHAATASLTAAGDTFELVGLLYLQGESDSAAEAVVAGSRFQQLLENLRVDLHGAENLHGLIAGIASATAEDDTVRAMQRTVAEGSASIGYFDNLDLQPFLHDGLHFNKEAKLAVGQRFAQAVLDAGLVSRHYGRLLFVGDSITQGGNGRPGYRYRVFEHLASQGVPASAADGYECIGSVDGAYQNDAGPTPDVNGQSFVNRHDGHWGWRAAWISGRQPLPLGRYGVNNLGTGTLENWTGQTATFETADAGTVPYAGTTHVPDTAVIKIGINDLADGTPAAQVRDDIGSMIDQLRAANPGVRIHLCEVLASDNVARSAVDALNDLLPALVAGKNASSIGSPVWLVRTNDGFDPATLTYDKTHPNAEGERHVGDRISVALGVINEPVISPRGWVPGERASGDLGVTVFEGDDIWNSGSYTNGWTATGDIEVAAEGGKQLRVRHPGEAPGWLDGTASGWPSFAGEPWVVEMRLRFETNPNGFMVWLGTGSHRILVEIHGDRTMDFGGEGFQVFHDNLDGQFHTWRIEHDPSAARYHVWRDGQQLTPAGGAPYDQAAVDARLLLGDSTSGAFGDGFEVTVENLRMGRRFGGAQMHDGTAWIHGWSQVGGILAVPDEVGGLRVINTTGGGSWVEGTGTAWPDGNDGLWTVEIVMRVNSNPNGFMIWLGTGTKRVLIEVYADRTEDSGGQSFRVAHDNLDGSFHTWRIAHDPFAGVYHVWRDGLRLTALMGAPYDAAAADERMILGDFTGGGFGDGFDVTIETIRMDFANAWLPPGADADADGMSDLWEMEMFESMIAGDPEADDDGDSLSNLDEYLADTRPTRALSRFRALMDRSGGISVPESSTRRHYSLWFSSDLGRSDPWQPVAGAVEVAGNGGELPLGSPTLAGAAGFYRVSVGLP